MGMTHWRRVSGIDVNGNALNSNHQIDGPTAPSIKRRESLQNGTQGGILFLQRAAEEIGDTDAGSSLLDGLDPRVEDQDVSERRMRVEAKSIRKVTLPRHLSVYPCFNGFHIL